MNMQDFCKKKDISLFNNLSQVDQKRLLDFAFLVLFQSGGDKKFAKEILHPSRSFRSFL